MNFQDFLKIVKVLKSAYTNINFLPDSDAIKVWYHSLKDIPEKLLEVAVYQYITTNKFPPTVAELREIAVDTVSDDTGWSLGWKQVLSAIKRHGYVDEQGALASMDDITSEAVKRIGWRDICFSQNLSVERANFRMAYEQIEEQNRIEMVVPEKVQKKIEQLTKVKQIGEIK